MRTQIARSDDDILKCWNVLRELRPHLVSETFLQVVREMMDEGYHLAYIEEDGKAVAAIGFRYLQYLFNGKHFYIDDLSTLTAYRGKGYAGMLIDYVVALAKEQGYKTVTLDSGYTRHNAHRLYLNKGFVLASHHFSKSL